MYVPDLPKDMPTMSIRTDFPIHFNYQTVLLYLVYLNFLNQVCMLGHIVSEAAFVGPQDPCMLHSFNKELSLYFCLLGKIDISIFFS